MIKLENFETLGWEAAIRGMRNPMNSWDKSDSFMCKESDDGCPELCHFKGHCPVYNKNDFFVIGDNDLTLMKKLSKAGTDHRKFMRMVTVYVDITAPLYWWKEFDTYKVGTVANSCSTMHKIADKEFTIDDFSHDHLYGFNIPGTYNLAEDCFLVEENDGEEYYWTSENLLNLIIEGLNFYRNRYLETKDKKYWWQMIQLLPSSYNQKRTVMLNYEVLANMYHARKNHKLDEWREFCEWIEKLPYSELIIGQEFKDE